MKARATSKIEPRVAAATFAYAAVLAAITVYVHVKFLGRSEIVTTQVLRHRDVMDGTAFDPWVYRVLSELGVEALYDGLKTVGIHRAHEFAFVAFRFAQNVVIFLLSALYFRRLGLTRPATAFGLGLLAWGLSSSYANSDLRFDTWSDVIFLLVAALILLEGDHAFPWLIPLTALAATNRETSGMIPLLLAAVALHEGLRTAAGRRTAGIAATSFAVWLAIYLGLRGAIGDRPVFLPPGWDLLHRNVTDSRTWVNLFHTVGILPFVCVYAWRWWSAPLRLIAIAVVPVWVVVHFVAGLALETRLFAVPFVLVFVPGALVAVSRLEPRASTWGREVVASARGAAGGRALAAAGGLLLLGATFLSWYAVQRVKAPFSAAHPGPSTYPSAWAHVPVTAAALAALGVAALALTWLRRPVLLARGALVAVGCAATVAAYRAVATVSGLHFYPRGFPLSSSGLFKVATPRHQVHIVPAMPPDVPSSVVPRFGAYLALAAALALLCGALCWAFAELGGGPERPEARAM